jgi:hypothetical protein
MNGYIALARARSNKEVLWNPIPGYEFLFTLKQASISHLHLPVLFQDLLFIDGAINQEGVFKAFLFSEFQRIIIFSAES